MKIRTREVRDLVFPVTLKEKPDRTVGLWIDWAGGWFMINPREYCIAEATAGELAALEANGFGDLVRRYEEDGQVGAGVGA